VQPLQVFGDDLHAPLAAVPGHQPRELECVLTRRVAQRLDRLPPLTNGLVQRVENGADVRCDYSDAPFV